MGMAAPLHHGLGGSTLSRVKSVPHNHSELSLSAVESYDLTRIVRDDPSHKPALATPSTTLEAGTPRCSAQRSRRNCCAKVSAPPLGAASSKIKASTSLSDSQPRRLQLALPMTASSSSNTHAFEWT